MARTSSYVPPKARRARSSRSTLISHEMRPAIGHDNVGKAIPGDIITPVRVHLITGWKNFAPTSSRRSPAIRSYLVLHDRDRERAFEFNGPATTASRRPRLPISRRRYLENFTASC